MKKISSVLLFSIAAILTLVLLNIYLKFSMISATFSYTIDSELGQIVEPKQNNLFVNEGFSLVNINDYGHIGNNYKIEKEKEEYRIAIIGDSYVEGLQLFPRQHFINIIERELINNTNKAITVLNFGQSGLDINTSYFFYNNYVKKFNVDFVLFFVDNDDLSNTHISGKSPRPFYALKENELTIDRTCNNSMLYNLRANYSLVFNSALGKLLVNGYNLSAKGMAKKILFDKLVKTVDVTIKKKEVTTKIPYVNQYIINQILSSDNMLFVSKSAISDELCKLPHSKTISLSTPLTKLSDQGIDTKYWDVSRQYGHWNCNAHEAIGLYLASKLSLLMTHSNSN